MQTIIDDNLVPFESDVVKFIQNVVEGLAYLHHRKIAHLDIKVSSFFNLYFIILQKRKIVYASLNYLQFP